MTGNDEWTMTDVFHRTPVEPFIATFGGGVNSAALLIGLSLIQIRPDLITFADTGGEKPETYTFLEEMQAWCVRAGFPSITVVRTVGVHTGDRSLEDACRRLEILPSRTVGLGTCALRWKIEPQVKHLKTWPPYVAAKAAGVKPFKAIGYGVDEQRRVKVHEDEVCRYVFPLVEWRWDRERCLDQIYAAGLPLPPKSACFYCPSSTKTEVLQLAQTHPLLFQRAVEMERSALASKKMHSVKGLGRHWSWEALVAASTEEQRQFREAPVEACMVCLDGDAED